MRAALLPTPGDPFLVRHWLVNCERVWRNEVDEVRVLVNRQPDPEVRDYIRSCVERVGGVYSERTDGSVTSHGGAIGVLLDETPADVVVLLEDDARVRVPGALEQHFRLVEHDTYDVVGSPRGSASPELVATGARRWSFTEEFMGDLGNGAGMWPCFVFSRRDVLLSTDRDFGARGWQPGEYVLGLDHVCQTEVASDTFGGTAYQLRDSWRVLDVAQWKMPHLGDYYLTTYPDLPWFHTGSLSSGDFLSDDQFSPPDGYLTTMEERREWAHRLWWWRRGLDLYGHELSEHAARYRENWDRVRSSLGVDEVIVDAWGGLGSRLITWDESP